MTKHITTTGWTGTFRTARELNMGGIPAEIVGEYAVRYWTNKTEEN